MNSHFNSRSTSTAQITRLVRRLDELGFTLTKHNYDLSCIEVTDSRGHVLENVNPKSILDGNQPCQICADLDYPSFETYNKSDSDAIITNSMEYLKYKKAVKHTIGTRSRSVNKHISGYAEYHGKPGIATRIFKQSLRACFDLGLPVTECGHHSNLAYVLKTDIQHNYDYVSLHDVNEVKYSIIDFEDTAELDAKFFHKKVRGASSDLWVGAYYKSKLIATMLFSVPRVNRLTYYKIPTDSYELTIFAIHDQYQTFATNIGTNMLSVFKASIKWSVLCSYVKDSDSVNYINLGFVFDKYTNQYSPEFKSTRYVLINKKEDNVAHRVVSVNNAGYSFVQPSVHDTKVAKPVEIKKEIKLKTGPKTKPGVNLLFNPNVDNPSFNDTHYQVENAQILTTLGWKLLEDNVPMWQKQHIQCTTCGDIMITNPGHKANAQKKHGGIHGTCNKCQEQQEKDKYSNKVDTEIRQKLDELGYDLLDDGPFVSDAHYNVYRRECGHTYDTILNRIIVGTSVCRVCNRARRIERFQEKNRNKSKIFRENSTPWVAYRSLVDQLTRIAYAKNKDEINPYGYPLGTAGLVGAYQLDHVLSVRWCFDNGYEAEFCASVDNLQVISWTENLHKNIHFVPGIDEHVMQLATTKDLLTMFVRSMKKIKKEYSLKSVEISAETCWFKNNGLYVALQQDELHVPQDRENCKTMVIDIEDWRYNAQSYVDKIVLHLESGNTTD